MIMGSNIPTSSDLQLCLARNVQPITTLSPHYQNPKKKRTKLNRVHNRKPIANLGVASGPSSSDSSIILRKKPDPSAPKITRPCTECGKRFWSWKALFGHMRCHPERPWRGMNPPPNLHYSRLGHNHHEEDKYMAGCLLMLQNTPNRDRFECSSCKKVFGSYQALGGHRASHKNVKGCFAITRISDEGSTKQGEVVSHYDYSNQQQHKCSICLKIFSSGQALGGHKRCHLEKEDSVATTSSVSQAHPPLGFDLNLPASAQDDHDSYALMGCGFGLHL